jgi:uncharacterized protein YyaL (SSP411 family)
MAHSTDRPANRLAGETSPYLLQHAHNPVDWHPWDEEALARARDENKPIFLSIGYSACHWCHVMERESFESPEIARLMNAHFVCVKVDREERPDLDQIYMAAVQALSGHGGWPMSVFLTPDGRPFYGGTYYPPTDRRGMPGFDRVLKSVAQVWADRREDVLKVADQLTGDLSGLAGVPPLDGVLDHGLIDQAVFELGRSFEPVHGGFGTAPKFPHPMDLKVLLRQYARTSDVASLHMVRHTLDRMARGGIYDHLGGGFARYSTDDRWLVPHFEKMLYDNALLAGTYVEAHQVIRDEDLARVARETIDYVLTRMTDPDGGAFYATEDADSEGVEGKYYVWTLAEIETILGADRAKVFAAAYDVTADGNWEGHSILNLARTLEETAKDLGRDLADLKAELAVSRAELLAARDRRIPPGKDTKVLTSWNGLMIAALAQAGMALDEPRYLAAAEKAAGFILDRMRQPDGKLWHVFKDGRARLNAYLDDYACLTDGLTRLFEATGAERWARAAVELAVVLIDQFSDPDADGLFFTGRDHEELVVRQKDLIDNATPSGNGMAATALARLAALTGRDDLEQAADATLRALSGVIRRIPTAAGQALVALDFRMADPRDVVLVGGDDPAATAAAKRALGARFRPSALTVAAGAAASPALAELVPLLADRPARDGQVTLYVCHRNTCEAPVSGLDAVLERLERLA